MLANKHGSVRVEEEFAVAYGVTVRGEMHSLATADIGAVLIEPGVYTAYLLGATTVRAAQVTRERSVRPDRKSHSEHIVHGKQAAEWTKVDLERG